ncbi:MULTISPECIES: alpha/beta hydrolase [unclassified Mycobacterium]|uniref:alpha/beta hydrolase n=1 Tax=unclassified Mycobacterium TaxID=2642494 RepID=UPI00073FBBCE|nr:MULTISPECIES: alpha/beta hydrolase [unclassified Mycobacterium]KUH85835.1 alpha/beta hydrolase [Mycobacterium sp. GA-1999]KUH91691.1 alpha/beta hydrolase [Mycobacterium sp. GA-0227b]KUH96070.1 alpha/beta hydrolase [Mycobacterium sp. IS-1556]
MLLSDIDTWNVGALRSIAFELGGELTTIEGVTSDLELISRLPGWESPAADAARGKIDETTGRVLDDVAVIGAVQQLASETAAAVEKLQIELDAIRADIAAQGGLLTLSDNGDVTINAPPDMRDELRPIADNIEARAKALIRQAEDVDADCAEVFGHLEDGDITSKGATDFAGAQQMGRDQSGLSAPYPPEGEGATPEDVNAWWNALSQEEQDKVKAEHPDWIANRDGVPTPVRSELNKAALDRELADAQRAVDELPTLEEYLGGAGAGPGSAIKRSEYNRMVAERQDRLNDARAMRAAMSVDGKTESAYDPNKYLMLLEFPEDREARAAIAVGNPDTAEHVSVTTPGVDTRPTSLPGMVNEATALRNETVNQLELAKRPGEEVSTIAWLGYEPPGKDISVLEAGFENRANDAAPDLADFYRGINATNEHGSDVHLSALGHSYGSLTTAQALYELGQTGVVDDAAFYGSPGLGHTDEVGSVTGVHGVPLELMRPIGDESDMFLQDGHAYVMSAPGDWISGDPKLGPIPMPSAGDLGQFGPNPTTLPLEQLSSEAARSPTDNVSRAGAESHADYPRSDDGGVLRTTGYNLAIITGGLAEVPLDNGDERLIR